MTHSSLPLLVVIGGFLGAGKTTIIQRAATLLRAEGQRVAIITNDQSSSLVDSEVARSASEVVAEIPDGCFCCRFDALQETLHDLKTAMPDVILAEAVGSCTDLAATVYQPLRQLTTGLVGLAPLTVVVDGLRFQEADTFGRWSAFPASVSYLFERQLAEADVILLNKVDLLAPSDQSRIVASLSTSYPGVAIVPISAARGEGIDAWRRQLVQVPSPGDRVLDLDYDRYADAEAALGWLNRAGTLRLAHPDLASRWIRLLLEEVMTSATRANAGVAHVKAWIDTPAGSVRGHIVGNGGPPDIIVTGAPAREARVLVNARVSASPEALEQWVGQAIRRAGDALDVPFQETGGRAFSPPRPIPLHRLLPAAQPPRVMH